MGPRGTAAYGVVFALAEDLLRSGSVVIDSASHYRDIPARGLAIAERRGAVYRFVECVCDDDEELARRLWERTPRRSQMLGVGVPLLDTGTTVLQLYAGHERHVGLSDR